MLVGGVQSLAKVRVKGSVTAGDDGLAVNGHASTSLEISSRSALAVWGWRIGEQQSWCVGRGELLPGFVVGGFCFCCLGFLVASPLGWGPRWKQVTNQAASLRVAGSILSRANNHQNENEGSCCLVAFQCLL